jgi:cell wall-associated NlpC family hydrolase
MNGTRRHSSAVQRLGALAVAIALVTVAVPAWAEPTVPPSPATSEPTPTVLPGVTDALARLEAFKQELDELDRELGVAAEAYNASQIELEATKENVATSQRDLENAEIAYDVQLQAMKLRIRDLYKNSSLDVLEVVLGSKSIADLVSRIQFLSAISEANGDAVLALKAQRDHMRTTSDAVKTAQEQAAEIEFRLKARKIEVELRIEEREAMLAEAESDLIELLNSDLAARAAEESALMRDILSGANKAGIDLTPGGVVETALAYSGIPYVWAGETPSGGFDCSGLVLYVFRQHGVNLPHYSRLQFTMGEPVTPTDLRPGDTVFFGTPVYHVGIYAGGGYFIHAPRTGDVVKLSKLAERKDYAGARRYAWTPRTGAIQGVSSN